MPDEGGNIAARLGEILHRHGVRTIFGQSIPSLLYLVGTTPRGMKQAAYRTENAGGAMADAYARISGRVGIVTAQNGPAATLLVAPLAEALKASIPVIALVQDVPRHLTDKNAFQDFDHIRMFESCTKWVRRVARADRLEDYVDMAFVAASSGRPGPVALMLPADLLAEKAVPAGPRRAVLGHFPLDRAVPALEALTQAARLIAEAETPLMIAGGGVHISGAADELAALQQEWHLPVATTSMGKGAVDETHPLSLGVVGYFMAEGSRTEKLRARVERADIVMLVGTRTNQNGTDSWTIPPASARVIHIDTAPEEIGRNGEALRLNGDARTTLAGLRAALSKLDGTKRASLRRNEEEEISTAAASWRERTERIRTADQSPIRPERVMHELDHLLTPNTIVAADASYASVWIANNLTARRPGQRFLSPRGLAGLGWGLPFAIGAKLAAPIDPVICVAGDGGFAHTWAELETIRRLDLVIVIIVLNNQILGYQKHAEQVQFGNWTSACEFTPVDHAAIARACGVSGIRIERPDDIRPALMEALASDRSTVIDVVIDPDAFPPIGLFEGKLPSPF